VESTCQRIKSRADLTRDSLMSFSPPTTEQRLAVESIREFVRSEVRPVAQAYRNRQIPRERMLELHQAIAEFALPGGAIPRAHGGWGLTQAMLFEELVKASAPVSASVLINMLVAHTLLLASPSLRDGYLPDIIAGKRIGGLSVVGFGGNETGLFSRRDGDCLIVCGEEPVIGNGAHADFVVCAVRAEDAGRSHVIIDRDEHGYEAWPIEPAASHLRHAARIRIPERGCASTTLWAARVIWFEISRPSGTRRACSLR